MKSTARSRTAPAATLPDVRRAFNVHVAEADPHPVYTTATELSDAVAAHAAEADPHTGYQKESEKGAASGYASLDGATLVPVAQLPAATTTTKGVVELATDGESGAGVVPAGNDSRLSNARTPTAHAASHENGGSDPVTSDLADVTGTLALGNGGTGATTAAAARTALELASSATLEPTDIIIASTVAVRVLATETGDPVRTVGASSTAEETLCSMSVPALGTTGMVVLELWADMLQNSGGNNSSRLKVKLGATTIFNGSTSIATDVDQRSVIIRVVVIPRGATNKQRVEGYLMLGAANAAGSGFGNWGSQNPLGPIHNDSAEDLTSAKTLAITHQWETTAHASSYLRLYGAKLIYYP